MELGLHNILQKSLFLVLDTKVIQKKKMMKAFSECRRGCEFQLFHFRGDFSFSTIQWGKGHHLSYDERQDNQQSAFALQKVGIIWVSPFHPLRHCHPSYYISTSGSFPVGLCTPCLQSLFLPFIFQYAAGEISGKHKDACHAPIQNLLTAFIFFRIKSKTSPTSLMSLSASTQPQLHFTVRSAFCMPIQLSASETISHNSGNSTAINISVLQTRNGRLREAKKLTPAHRDLNSVCLSVSPTGALGTEQ